MNPYGCARHFSSVPMVITQNGMDLVKMLSQILTKLSLSVSETV
jgi:hypothetical protein